MKTKNNVLVFIFIAFGFSWLFWVPDALIAQNIWNAPSGVRKLLAGPFNLGPWGPLFAALSVTTNRSCDSEIFLAVKSIGMC